MVTPDVAEQYPAPFYEPFTTLSWLAGVTERITLGTTVLIAAYRHPLLVARMAANLADLSGGRFVLGVGTGWARQEYAALGVPFEQRGRLTDAYLTHFGRNNGRQLRFTDADGTRIELDVTNMQVKRLYPVLAEHIRYDSAVANDLLQRRMATYRPDFPLGPQQP